jgi:hypothetical protein
MRNYLITLRAFAMARDPAGFGVPNPLTALDGTPVRSGSACCDAPGAIRPQ